MVIQNLTPNDLDALCELDKLCFDTSWTRESLSEESGVGIFEESCLLAAILTREIAGERWIFRIMTHPKYQRQGLAQKLLEAFSKESLWLEVSVNNLGAIKFYEQAGFKIVARRPNYYPEDALVMRKSSSDPSLDL